MDDLTNTKEEADGYGNEKDDDLIQLWIKGKIRMNNINVCNWECKEDFGNQMDLSLLTSELDSKFMDKAKTKRKEMEVPLRDQMEDAEAKAWLKKLFLPVMIAIKKIGYNTSTKNNYHKQRSKFNHKSEEYLGAWFHVYYYNWQLFIEVYLD